MCVSTWPLGACAQDVEKALGGADNSPTGSINIDAMVDSLMHELAEVGVCWACAGGCACCSASARVHGPDCRSTRVLPSQAVSDPLVSGGWYDDGIEDVNENENADVCAGRLGKLKTWEFDDGTQSKYNQVVGPDEKLYVWQQLWLPGINPKTKKPYGCVSGV